MAFSVHLARTKSYFIAKLCRTPGKRVSDLLAFVFDLVSSIHLVHENDKIGSVRSLKICTNGPCCESLKMQLVMHAQLMEAG